MKLGDIFILFFVGVYYFVFDLEEYHSLIIFGVRRSLICALKIIADVYFILFFIFFIFPMIRSFSVEFL